MFLLRPRAVSRFGDVVGVRYPQGNSRRASCRRRPCGVEPDGIRLETVDGWEEFH